MTNHLQATGYILFSRKLFKKKQLSARLSYFVYSRLLQSVVEEEEVEEEENDTAQEYRNDGYIELVLKVMARMCDGQNHQLQVKWNTVWKTFCNFS